MGISGSVMGSVNGGFIGDDSRSHVSGYSMNKASVNGSGVNLIRTRSLVDGQGQQQQQQRSISALSGRGATYLPPGLHHSSLGAMGHHHLAGLGLGLGGLNMGPLGGSMNMAGLPTLSGLGALSRAGNSQSANIENADADDDSDDDEGKTKRRQDTPIATISVATSVSNASTSTRKRHSKSNKHRQAQSYSSSSTKQLPTRDDCERDNNNCGSTTALVPAEALPASSTETLTSSTQA